MVTLSGAAYVMPRSWHSCMSYFSCRPTGSPHLLQNVTTFLLKVPQWLHRMSPAWNGSVRMVAPQLAAGGPQVVQPFQVAALALPVADRIVHELEFAHPAEIRDGKNRIEHSLQADVFALVRQKIHLQKALVGFLLNFDQVGNRNGSFDLGEIHSLTCGGVIVAYPFVKTPDGGPASAETALNSTMPTAHRKWGPHSAPKDETRAGIEQVPENCGG